MNYYRDLVSKHFYDSSLKSTWNPITWTWVSLQNKLPLCNSFFCISLLKKSRIFGFECAFNGSAISYGFIYFELFDFFSRWELPPQVSNLIDQSAARHFMRNFNALKIDNIRDYLRFILINEKKLFRVKWIVRICMRRIHQQHYEVLWREKISQTIQTLLKAMWEKKK